MNRDRKCITIAAAIIWITGVSSCDTLTGERIGSESALFGLERAVERQVAAAVREPSDLAFDPETNSFWTVSDTNGAMYRLSPDGTVAAGPVDLKASDLEGIAFDPKTAHLFVTDEKKREVLEVARTGEVLRRFSVPGGKGNNGIEGIAYDPSTDGFVLVNERNPAEILFVTRTGQVSGRVTVKTQDLSAVTVGPDGKSLFVAARFEEAVLEVDRQGRILNRLKINAPGIEGLAFDAQGRLFAVADLGRNGPGILYLYSKGGRP